MTTRSAPGDPPLYAVLMSCVSTNRAWIAHEIVLCGRTLALEDGELVVGSLAVGKVDVFVVVVLVWILVGALGLAVVEVVQGLVGGVAEVLLGKHVPVAVVGVRDVVHRLCGDPTHGRRGQQGGDREGELHGGEEQETRSRR